MDEDKEIKQKIIDVNANSPSHINGEQACDLLSLIQHYTDHKNYIIALYYLNKTINYGYEPITKHYINKTENLFHILTPQAQNSYLKFFEESSKVLQNDKSTLNDKTLKNLCQFSTHLAHFVSGKASLQAGKYKHAYKHFEYIANSYSNFTSKTTPFYLNDNQLLYVFTQLTYMYLHKKIPILNKEEYESVIKSALNYLRYRALQKAKDEKSLSIALGYAKDAYNLKNIDRNTKAKIGIKIGEIVNLQRQINITYNTPKVLEKRNSCRITKEKIQKKDYTKKLIQDVPYNEFWSNGERSLSSYRKCKLYYDLDLIAI